MNTQPTALRLIDVYPYLEGGERSQWIMDAAAELRRLHALNQKLLKALKACRDDLRCAGFVGTLAQVEDAIAKAQGEQA